MRKRLKVEKIASESRLFPPREHCANPWNGECENTDIELYIYYKGTRLPICHDCWPHIAESDISWGS